MLAGHLPGLVDCGAATYLGVAHAADGTGLLLLLADVDDRPAGTATLTVEDLAPVQEAPCYGRVRVSGPLTRVDGAEAREALLAFATANPHPELFDVGYGRSLWRMDVERVAVSDGGSGQDVDVSAYRAAMPDPLRRDEAQILADLSLHHPQFTGRLLRCIPDGQRPQPPGSCRVVRVDRYGLVVATGPATYRRVRLPRAVASTGDLATLLHPLLCGACSRDRQPAVRYGLLSVDPAPRSPCPQPSWRRTGSRPCCLC